MQLPESLKYIENEVFSNNPKLQLTSLPKNLVLLSTNNFNGCFSQSGLGEMNFEIGGKLKVLLSSCFNYCDIKWSSVTIGDEGDPSQLDINNVGYDFFNQNQGYQL